jgi:branched-chain amino acid transport system substrate-binding protein
VKWTSIALVCAGVAWSTSAGAGEDSIKIGLVVPLTGQLAPTGQQVVAGARLFIAKHGDIVAGRKIDLIVRDDGGAADGAKRITQELLVNQGVRILIGGLTPSAFAMAPLATAAKVPMVIAISGTSSLTERSPYVVRVSFTLGQSSAVLGEWSARNGAKRAVIVQSDWAPGAEASLVFADRFKANGGEITETIKTPLANPDFAPFLQRAGDLKPDILFVFVPAWQAGTFAKQFAERGLDQSGIRLIGPGDITDDHNLAGMGNEMLGVVTAGNYSASHPSATNQAYVSDFKAANGGLRPNFLSVGGYDAISLIYRAIGATEGSLDGDRLVAAMKGVAWESPRGPISIDAETRDIVQNIYLRKVERLNGELYNVEFTTFEAVKDPLKERPR